MFFKVFDELPVYLHSLMGLEMQIVQDKLEVIDKRDERSSFLLFIHGLK
jgi:hypothetical protein